MEKQKVDPILMVAAALALIATVYVFYITVFEQIISQNQGYFYAIIFGFILLVLFLLCNLFTKLIAISGAEQRSSYRRLIITAGLVVIAGLFLVTRMRYSTLRSPGENAIYRSAVAMADGSYSQSHDLIESGCANPGQYLFSLLLSIIFRFAEPGAAPIQWTNALFIVLCGFLTYKIVRTFTNQMCGLFAVILCAVIPSQTFAVYSFTSEPMVAAIFLGAVLALISLFSYNKRVKEMDDYGDEGDRDLAGIIFTVIGAVLIGLLLFVEPFMIIPMALMVIMAYIGRNPKAIYMLIAFGAAIVLLVMLCFAKSAHMGTDFGKVISGELSAFDPATDYNSGEVSEFGDVYHSFNVELSSTDKNITDNYTFITDSTGAGAYTEMSASWLVVLNQIMYMFVLTMTISCIILAVKEQKDYVVAISMLIVGAVIMLLFQQNRENQKFLFITVFIIASSTGLHYLYLDHHPELKVGINALDALEKTGRKEMAAATRSNLKNAAQMTEADFVKRAKALIFVGNDESLYSQIKEEEHERAQKYYKRPERKVAEEAFDDYDDDFFLDNEDDAAYKVTVTAVAPSGIRQTVAGNDAYEPNAEMHESASAAFNNTSIPAWKRPERFGDDEMFDEEDPEHSIFDGRDALETSEGVTTNDPIPEVEKVTRNKAEEIPVPEEDSKEKSAKSVKSTKVAKADKVKPEKAAKGRFTKVRPDKKVKPEKPSKAEKQAKAAPAATNTMSGGKAVRRIKTVGSGAAAVMMSMEKPEPSVKPSEPLPNPLPVPKKKDHKPMDFDKKVKMPSADDWDFDIDVGDDDDWDV